MNAENSTQALSLNHTTLPHDASAVLTLLEETFKNVFLHSDQHHVFRFESIHIDLYTADDPLRITLRREDTLTDETSEIPIYTNQLTGEVYFWSLENENLELPTPPPPIYQCREPPLLAPGSLHHARTMTNDPQHRQAGELLARLFHEAACRRLTGFERLSCTTSLQGHDLILEAQQDAEGALYLDLVLPQTARPAGLLGDTLETTALRLSFDIGSARELADTITDWLNSNSANDTTI